MPAERSHHPAWGAGVGALAAVIALMVVVRLAAAHFVGLVPDEMYYWVWSRNLASSYFDHPPAVAYFIRLSTVIAGDEPLGVRWLAIILSGLLSIGIYRLAARLYEDRALAIGAAALVQATLFIGFGSIFVTPDTTLVLFWCLALLCAAELWRSGRGAWWLATGASVGCAFVSKYTALFLGFGLVAWVVIVPEMRRWLRSPWPYAGALISLALAVPVVIWNVRHNWASFAKQFGRAVPTSINPGFLAEFLAGQAALLTPLVAILMACGFLVVTRETAMRRDAGAALLTATTLPLLGYFLYHSMFARVEGNWTAPLVPAVAIMAAVSACASPTAPWLRRTLSFSSRWAVPVGLVLSVLLLAHAAFRLIRAPSDPFSQTGGWELLVRDAERLAAEHGAGTIAGVSYQVTSALRYFGRTGLPTLQLTERIRYAMEPEPDVVTIRSRPLLILAEPREGCRALVGAERAFGEVRNLGTLTRRWKGDPAAPYLALLASQPHGTALPDLTVPRITGITCGELREQLR
jgi:hypothetical protein